MGTEPTKPSRPIKETKIILRPYNPISWFHSRGIKRVLARLIPRLPDVSGKLFLTFTVNPLLYADPSAAFEHSRQKLRRVFYALRHGVEWEGKRYVLTEPYAVKVEFGGNEWAHFHAVFLTRRFLPGPLLTELWGLGRPNIARISNEKFRYLLKYVTKGGGLPDWVKSRKRLRVFQASRGFLLTEPKKKPETKCRKKKRRPSDSIGERIERQSKTALLQDGTHFAQLQLSEPFDELHGRNLLGAAEAGRYLGQAHYEINDIEDLSIWTNQLH
ncbi:MAG: hypothetical protein WC378_05165 [Opitutaceae bacterium]|jgi:hypothetical protein